MRIDGILGATRIGCDGRGRAVTSSATGKLALVKQALQFKLQLLTSLWKAEGQLGENECYSLPDNS